MMSVGHYRDTGKKGVPTVTGYSLLFPGIRPTQEVSQELSNLETDSAHCCAVLVDGMSTLLFYHTPNCGTGEETPNLNQ